MAKDIRLQGQQLIGTSCEDKKEVVHPETCLGAILLGHETSDTLKKWLTTPPNGSQTRALPLEDSLYQWLVQNYDIQARVDFSNYYTKAQVDRLVEVLSVLADANTNGYMSSADFAKLVGIEAGAEKNVKGDLRVTDADDASYIKGKDEFKADIIASIGIGINIEVVDELPTDPEEISYSTIYFVPHTPSEPGNVYDEYIRIQARTQSEVDRWELIGTTSLDLASLAGLGLVYANDKLNTNGAIIPVESHTDETATDTAFTVLGVTVGSYTTGDVIKKSDSIEKILKNILIKTIDVVVGHVPSARMTNSGTSAGTYEVGTKLHPVLGITLNSISGYTSGHFKSADPDNWTSIQEAGCSLVAGSTVYYRGSTEMEGNTEGDEGYEIGEETVRYNAKFNYSANSITPVKNNGDASSVIIPAATNVGTKNADDTDSYIEYKGRYKYYLGLTTFRNMDWSGYFNSITTSMITGGTFLGGTTAQTTTAIGANGQTSTSAAPTFILVIPAEMSIKTSQNSLGASNLDAWKRATTGTITHTNGKEYKVYVLESSGELLIKNVTIGQ